jgi:hypothetical protein
VYTIEDCSLETEHTNILFIGERQLKGVCYKRIENARESRRALIDVPYQQQAYVLGGGIRESSIFVVGIKRDKEAGFMQINYWRILLTVDSDQCAVKSNIAYCTFIFFVLLCRIL